MSRFTVIDLSGLPPPAVVETLDGEAIVKAMRDDLVALDTGCVWGGALSAVRLEGHRTWQVACPRAQVPSTD